MGGEALFLGGRVPAECGGLRARRHNARVVARNFRASPNERRLAALGGLASHGRRMASGAPDFERLVAVAADVVGATHRQLPSEIRGPARQVAVHYETLPGADVLAEGFPADILGLFTGDPHGTEGAHDVPAPAQILLYLENLWDFAEGDLEIFKDEVRTTYLHELGHYFGWDEDDLTARGLD